MGCSLSLPPPFLFYPCTVSSGSPLRALASSSVGAVALAFKKTKPILATAYLAEKAFKKLGVNQLVFPDAFSFLSKIIPWGEGRGNSFASAAKEQHKTESEILRLKEVRSKL